MGSILTKLDSLLGLTPPQYGSCEIITCERLSNSDLQTLWGNGTFVMLFTVAIIGLLLWLSLCKGLYPVHRYINRFNILPTCFCIVWATGFVVYDVGMYTGEHLSIWGNAPMAVLHAFGMFLLDSDVSAIHEPLHNNWIYMMCFSLAHLAAALVSMAFVVKHFGYNIAAGIKRFYYSRIKKQGKEKLYIYFGE